MFGRNEITRLELQKQALVLQSGLNRLELQQEVHNVRLALGGIARVGQKSAPFLLLLAPLAGFFVARGMWRRPVSWLSSLAKATKWIGPAYTLWRTLSAGRKKQAAGEMG